MSKTPEVGEGVLFHGRFLVIINKLTDPDRVEITDQLVHAEKQELTAEVVKLRAIQAAEHEKSVAAGERFNSPEWEKAREEIEAIDVGFRGKWFAFKLKAENLQWYPAGNCWVSPGRILSDDQVAQYCKLTGEKRPPADQRVALAYLNSME